MVPNFIGIGVQRAGTSWIYQCLNEHPEIYMSNPKEIHFFDLNYENGLNWYKDHFEKVNGQLCSGEFTPDYISHPKAAKRIYNDFNKHEQLKFIVSLRDPVDRLYSQYKLYLRKGKYNLKFEKALEKYPENFIKEIYGFLGVDKSFIPEDVNQRRNRGLNKNNFAIKLFKKISNIIVNNKMLLKIVRPIYRTKFVNFILEKLIFGSSKKDIPPELNKELYSYYSDQIEKLSVFLDRDLKKVWK